MTVLLARGPWPEESVRASFDARPLAFDGRAREALERAWKRAQEDALASGRTLWNGRVAGLASFRASQSELSLRLHATDYREFVGTNLSAEYRARSREEAPRSDALGLSLVVVSGETVILHRRGAANFEWPLAIDTPGGHVEPGKHDDESGVPSVFRATRDELEGELGIESSEVLSLRVLALTRMAETEKPQLIVLARIALSPEEVRSRLPTARERFETSELLPVARSELAKLARSGELVSPAGRAALEIASGLL
ncbi:hypothetical protein HY251_11155 [bacterium]|nr:hypothetical protein [bacterium]